MTFPTAKQSNSRVVRWSDGSLSLQLGNALFDVNPNVDTSATLSRTALGSSTSQSQSQTVSQSLMPVPPQSQHPLRSHGYLVAQHERPEVLQAEKVITGHISLRPTGMQSETHRRLVGAVGQKHNKVARFKMAPNELVTSDPNIPARPRCTPRARPPLHHTHTPGRPHMQATPCSGYLRKGPGDVCALRTPSSPSRNAPMPARPRLQATLLPFPHAPPGRPRLQATHPPVPHAMPGRPQLPATRRPVPHAMSCHPRLQATCPPIPHTTPTHLAVLICRPHAGPSLMPRSHGWLSSFAGHTPAHLSCPPIQSRHAHMPGCLCLHASHAPAPLSPPSRLRLQVMHLPVSHARLHLEIIVVDLDLTTRTLSCTVHRAR